MKYHKCVSISTKRLLEDTFSSLPTGLNYKQEFSAGNLRGTVNQHNSRYYCDEQKYADENLYSFCGNMKRKSDSQSTKYFILSFPVLVFSAYLLTYLLTQWCGVLEKLTGLQLVKILLAFHGTRRFITALTSVRHLSLSWANPIQSTYPHPISWRYILILSTHLRLGLPSDSFPPVSPPRPYTHT